MPITVRHRNRPVSHFRADIVVSDLVLLELKARNQLEASNEAQLLNCLRATSIEVGLLLNFGPRPEFKSLVYSNGRKPAADDAEGGMGADTHQRDLLAVIDANESTPAWNSPRSSALVRETP